MAYYITRANLEQTLAIRADEIIGVARKMMFPAKIIDATA